MCALQMLRNLGGRERDQHLGVNLCIKSIRAEKDAAALLTTSAPQGYNVLPATDAAPSILTGRKKRSSAFVRPAQGWTEQGCREGWKTRRSPEELSRSVRFISELLSEREKLLVPKQGAFGESHTSHLITAGPLQLSSLFIHIRGLLFL